MISIAGLFAVACTLQDVTPLGEIETSEPHHLSLVARDGRGAMVGWSDLGGQQNVQVRQNRKGIVTLSGLSWKGDVGEVWAVLTPQPNSNTFAIEWLMYDHRAVDGRMTAAVWSKGQCERLTAAPSSDK